MYEMTLLLIKRDRSCRKATPKAEEVGKLDNGAKLNTGPLRRPQPTKIHEHKARTYEVGISDVSKKTGLKDAEAK